MEIADSAAKRSKDPSTQHGACIINPDTKRIVSVGYNGLPRGMDDDGNYKGVSYWDSVIKYEYALHAEQNAILNAKEDLRNKVLYLSSEKGYYPCTMCSAMIAQVEISEVVMKWAIQENTNKYNFELSKHILSKAGVKIRILTEQKGS